MSIRGGMSWGMGGGSGLPVDSLIMGGRPSKAKVESNLRPKAWGRKELRTRDEQVDSREPFRCSEPTHRKPRVRWLSLIGILERKRTSVTEQWPICCGQIMELVPSDEANEMRDRLIRNLNKTLTIVEAPAEGENVAPPVEQQPVEQETAP